MKKLSFIKQCESGLAAMEFALMLPLMITMIVGVAEISRFALFQQKLSTAAFNVADYVTQNEQVTVNMLNDYVDTVNEIIKPFGFQGTVIFSSIASSANPGGGSSGATGSGSGGGSSGSGMTGGVTISGVTGVGGRTGIGGGSGGASSAPLPSTALYKGCKPACVVWQYKVGSDPSQIGIEGKKATLPGNYELLDTQNIIAVEVYGQFAPILPISQNIINALAPHKNYSVALTKPRQDSLLDDPVP